MNFPADFKQFLLVWGKCNPINYQFQKMGIGQYEELVIHGVQDFTIVKNAIAASFPRLNSEWEFIEFADSKFVITLKRK